LIFIVQFAKHNYNFSFNNSVSHIKDIIVYNKYIIICYDFCIKFYNLELYLLKKQTVDNKIVIFEMIDNKIMTISSDDEILRLYDIYDTNIKSTYKNITKSLTQCKSNSLIIRLKNNFFDSYITC